MIRVLITIEAYNAVRLYAERRKMKIWEGDYQRLGNFVGILLDHDTHARLQFSRHADESLSDQLVRLTRSVN